MSDNLRILVIDDDPVMRELLEAVLGFAGHDVESFDSGDAAVSQLERTPARPDVVLTDLHMPGLQGQQLAARLLELRPPGTLLLGMSGSFPTEDETSLLDFFLQKPFTPEQFADAVQSARELHHTPGTPAPTSVAAAIDSPTTVLNDKVFARLCEALPAQQLRELYALTVDDVSLRAASMHAAAAAGDLPTVRRQAHAIKGACGMVGATELYTLAATTEGGTDLDTLPIAEFIPACERLKRMLDERLAN